MWPSEARVRETSTTARAVKVVQAIDDCDTKEFDYVVVGAGTSAMGLVFGLLSPFQDGKEVPPFSIVVLERGQGPSRHASATWSPNQWCDASHTPSQSVRLLQSKIGSRIIDVPVGQGLGGTTNVNACLCTPPASHDFLAWPKPWNKSLLSSTRVIQDAMIANGAIHVHSANDVPYELPATESQSCPNPQRETVFPSLVADIPLSVAQKDDGVFVRKTYYESLVEPLLQANPHLAGSISFVHNFDVQRLLFSNDNPRQSTGVEGPQNQRIVCRREVILCAGAIESPALLLVSGIGPTSDLIQLGVDPLVSCSGVGRSLRDHVLVPRVFLSAWSPRTLSPNGVHALCHERHGEHCFQFILNDAGVYSQLVPHFLASFVRRHFSRPTFLVSVANSFARGLFVGLRFILRLLVTYTPAYYILRYHVIIMNIALLNPKSTGKVTIQNIDSNCNKKPLRRKDIDVLIDSGYLNHPDDAVALWEGWKKSNQRFDKFLSQGLEIFPGIPFRGSRWTQIRNPSNGSWFRWFASQFCLPYFHWCGTCAMQTDQETEWVVDSNLIAKSLSRVRVCDASVFPSTISGPTALTCAALGHSLALMLLDDTNGKKER